MDIMSACDPSYRALHKPSENGVLEGRPFEIKLFIYFLSFQMPLSSSMEL